MQDQLLNDIKRSAQKIPMPEWTLRAQIAAGNVNIIRLGKRIMIATPELERIAGEGLPSLRSRRVH